jgi:hypothetical protein
MTHHHTRPQPHDAHTPTPHATPQTTRGRTSEQAATGPWVRVLLHSGGRGGALSCAVDTSENASMPRFLGLRLFSDLFWEPIFPVSRQMLQLVFFAGWIRRPTRNVLAFVRLVIGIWFPPNPLCLGRSLLTPPPARPQHTQTRPSLFVSLGEREREEREDTSVTGVCGGGGG